jgi:hypothetical protein
MVEFDIVSELTLYVLLLLFGLFTLILGWFQFNVFRGRAMNNPDGTVDDWHEQKILFGMAIGDLVIICPITILSIILILVENEWGFFILSLVSFWYVWVNLAFTLTSLRFENPRITAEWIVAFPFGSILGFAYLVWILINFSVIF